MTYLGDPTWWLNETEYNIGKTGHFETMVPEMPWWERKAQMETRPVWGKYWPNDYPDDKDLDFFERPIYGWLATGVSCKTPIEDVKEITDWLIENIDNVWEGPIGYLGYWKFRFTVESDAMIFKLIK